MKIGGWETTFLLGRLIFRGELLVSGKVPRASVLRSVLSKTKETVGRSPSWLHPTDDFVGKICPVSLPTCEHVGCHHFSCYVVFALPKAFNNKSRELRLPREVKACQKQSKRPDCNVPQLVLVTFLWTTMQQGPTKTDFTVKQISSSLPSILCLVQHPTLSKTEEMNSPV